MMKAQKLSFNLKNLVIVIIVLLLSGLLVVMANSFYDTQSFKLSQVDILETRDLSELEHINDYSYYFEANQRLASVGSRISEEYTTLSSPFSSSSQNSSPLQSTLDTLDQVDLEAKTFSITSEYVTWGHDRVGALPVQNLPEYNNETIVAVLDTGVAAHPELMSILLPGYDFVNNDTNATDDNGHGTHVAGIIAAANNNTGVIGVIPNTRILPIKVIDSDGLGSLGDVMAGIDYAIEQRADVINLSLGTTFDSIHLRNSIQRALNVEILVVASSGNDAEGNCLYPGRYDGVICVGATNEINGLASYSNLNPDIVAPGDNILSTIPGGDYSFSSGTSMATPFVSGGLALAKSACPGCTTEQIKQYVFDTVTDLGIPGKDSSFGYGLLNIQRLVLELLDDATVPLDTSYNPGSISPVEAVDGAELVEATWKQPQIQN
jgi:subtilisin family serine protease